MIRWDINKADAALITKIVKRAAPEMCGEAPDDFLDLTMDVTACHLNDVPLDLPALLAAEDFEFFHDVGGIRRHINRRTGKLGNCFLPRYARKPAPLTLEAAISRRFEQGR